MRSIIWHSVILVLFAWLCYLHVIWFSPQEILHKAWLCDWYTCWRRDLTSTQALAPFNLSVPRSCGRNFKGIAMNPRRLISPTVVWATLFCSTLTGKCMARAVEKWYPCLTWNRGVVWSIMVLSLLSAKQLTSWQSLTPWGRDGCTPTL